MYIASLLQHDKEDGRKCLDTIECDNLHQVGKAMNSAIYDQNFTGGLLESTTSRMVGSGERQLCHVIEVYKRDDVSGDLSPYIEIIAPVSAA